MKTFILSENGAKKLEQNIIKEAYYSDHVER